MVRSMINTAGRAVLDHFVAGVADADHGARMGVAHPLEPPRLF